MWVVQTTFTFRMETAWREFKTAKNTCQWVLIWRFAINVNMDIVYWIMHVCLTLYLDAKNNKTISVFSVFSPSLKNNTIVKYLTVKVTMILAVLPVIVATISPLTGNVKKSHKAVWDTIEAFALTVCLTSNSRAMSVILMDVWIFKDSNVYSAKMAIKVLNLAAKSKTA